MKPSDKGDLQELQRAIDEGIASGDCEFILYAPNSVLSSRIR